MSDIFYYFLLALRRSPRISEIKGKNLNRDFESFIFWFKFRLLGAVLEHFSQCNFKISYDKSVCMGESQPIEESFDVE